MRNIIVILSVILLVGCYNSADKPHIAPELPTPTTTIAHLHEIVGTGGRLLDSGIVVEGRVVSSDAEYNFYKSIYVEADGYGVEVMMGLTQLDARYPEGLKVALCLGGCYADYHYGVLRVGRDESGAVGYLNSQETMDRVVVRSMDVQSVAPRAISLANLDRDMCGTLVRAAGLRLVDASSVDVAADESLADARWAGYTLFKDERGDSIALYARDYALFSEESVPHGEVDVTGIVQWGKYNGGKECYQLVMRYATDCVAH